MDIEDTISIQETAKRLQKSTKTVYRWIAQGKLPAVKVGMQYFIKVDVVEALASGQVVQRDDVVQRVDTMDTRLQMLEYRMANLERRVDAIEVDDDLAIRISDVEQRLAEMEQERNTPKVETSESPQALVEVSPLALPRYEKPVRIANKRETEATLPEGHVNYTQFYRDHGISSGMADRARGKKFFPVQVGNWWDERGHPITLALDALGMWNFCVYFKSKGKLRECSRQGCACHEV